MPGAWACTSGHKASAKWFKSVLFPTVYEPVPGTVIP